MAKFKGTAATRRAYKIGFATGAQVTADDTKRSKKAKPKKLKKAKAKKKAKKARRR